MSETSIVTDDHQEGEIKPKKVQSESLKRAKAKYYSKKKVDPEFMEQNRNNTTYKIRNTTNRNVESTTWSISKTYTTKQNRGETRRR